MPDNTVFIPRPALRAVCTELDICHYLFGQNPQNDTLPSDWFQPLILRSADDTRDAGLYSDDVRKLIIRCTTALRNLLMQYREKLEEHLTLLRQLRVEKDKIEELLASREEKVDRDLLRFDTETKLCGDRPLLNMDYLLVGPETGWRAGAAIEGVASMRNEEAQLAEYAAIRRENGELGYSIEWIEYGDGRRNSFFGFSISQYHSP
jgi:hypothetical protein